MEGNDHKVSLLPYEFEEMVQHIRQVEEALGDQVTERRLSQGELINRENLAKSVFVKSEIKLGGIISRDNLEIRTPGKGLQPSYINQVIGKSYMDTQR